jgi:hypothetical protein
MVYDLPEADPDPDLLVNAQETMGAGGKSLRGPKIAADAGNGNPAAANGSSAEVSAPAPTHAPAQPAAGNTITVVVSSPTWVKIQWQGQNGPEDVVFVKDKATFPVRSSYASYLLCTRATEQGEWKNVQNFGKNEPFPTPTPGKNRTMTIDAR